MNKWPLMTLIVLLLVGVQACKKSTPSVAQAPPVATPEPLLNHAEGGTIEQVPQTRYFRGSIGSALGLHMKLIRTGDALTGTYYYQRIGTRIELRGTVDKDGNLTMEEFDPQGKPTGVFTGLWKSDSDATVNIVGNWSKPGSDKKTAFSLHQEPIEFTGVTEITSKTIKENNQKLKYEITADYPQITGALDTRFDKFNQEARNLITSKVTQFKKDIAARAAEAGESQAASETGSDLGIGYEIALARDYLISVEFNIGGYYAGAAHPNSHTVVINYDAKNGRVLKLADLFKPGAKYLETISAYAIKDLNTQAKGKDSGLTPETISEGAGPKAENFRSWTITRKGLALTFDSYQVGPYVAGPQQVIIPYSALKEIIRSDGPLGTVGAV